MLFEMPMPKEVEMEARGKEFEEKTVQWFYPHDCYGSDKDSRSDDDSGSEEMVML
jgi:hypothetical protein